MNTTDENQHLILDQAQPVDIFQYLGLSRGELERYKEADRILQLAGEISDVYLWILFAIGLPFNILTIITVATMKRLCPAKFLIALLAALDTASLICKLVGHQMFTYNFEIVPEVCKVEFLIPYTATLANWIVVLICAERFFTVCFKDKKPLIFSLRNCYIAVAVLSTSLLVVFAGIFISMRSVTSSGLRCGTYTRYRWFWINIWYWISAFLFLFLPSTMIIPMTALMLRKLLGSKRNGILQQNKEKSESEALSAGKSGLTEEELQNNKGIFTVMICIAAMFFVILCLPACIFLLSHSGHKDYLTYAQWVLFAQIQFLLADSTHALNFFLYFLSARQFRSKVVDILLCKPCRKRSYAPGQKLVLELTSDGSQSSQKKMSC